MTGLRAVNKDLVTDIPELFVTELWGHFPHVSPLNINAL